MKKNNLLRIASLLSLLLSLVAFYFGNLMTVNPLKVSGNGNLALIIIPLLLIFMVFLVYGWVQILNKFNLKSSVLVISLILLGFIFYFGYQNQANEYVKYKEYVQQTILNQDNRSADLEYVQSVTNGILSPYLNNQFFNVTTFSMYIVLSLSISVLVVLFTKPRFPKA